MQNRSLQIRFVSPDALREEFEKNIANRGIFVATDDLFEVRQTIDVEIVLAYRDDSAVVLSLSGEVVHCIPIEMAASGAVAGVAIQFENSANELQEIFSPLLESAPPPDPNQDEVEPERRAAKRAGVRVPVRIMPTMRPPFEATSRDLSTSGILLTMKHDVLPVGEIVRTCLWHPSGDPSVEIDGQVIRHVENKNGRVAAVAVAFDRNQSAEPRVRDVIDALRHAGHRSRLGGISGSVADLGLANMLQMFSSSVPQGTLVVERDGEQGWIAFANEQFLAAELGDLSGHDALVSMLDWGQGRFQFEALVDEKLIGSATPSALQGVVMKAVCALDERGSGDWDEESEGQEFEQSVSANSIDETTTFRVDLEQEEIARSSLDKTDEAVLELARSGLSAKKLKAIIPEPADRVQKALENLVELGVLQPR